MPVSSRPSSTASAGSTSIPADTVFKELEKNFDARLGIVAIDTGTGRSIGYRADERFAYASTYKALAAALVLKIATDHDLDTIVKYTAADLVTYSPITEKNVDTGMTLKDIADAAIRYSDNTAGNLLLRQLGGPKGYESALRSIGDSTTHADRTEPTLNEATPGDLQDTSTPRALAEDLQKLTTGNTLPPLKRDQLNTWLKGNTTGDKLIRASVPAGWEVGDKTGAGGYATRNDIAVIWPQDKSPIILSILSDRTDKDAEHDDALISAAANAAINALDGACGNKSVSSPIHPTLSLTGRFPISPQSRPLCPA